MSRILILHFRRDPSRDRATEKAHLEGYTISWPEDGSPVALGLDAFCTHGQRLLGLGKRLAGRSEKLVKMVFIPLSGRNDDLNRIPGYRVRRFYVQRTGSIGRLHFMDGTPTVAVFEIGRDEPRVMHWLGLDSMHDGEILWFDLAAVDVDTSLAAVDGNDMAVPHRQRLQAVEA